MATSWRTRMPFSIETERREHRHARARPVLGHRAGGDVDVDVALLEEVLRDAELLALART
jgi:hypothetical protein